MPSPAMTMSTFPSFSLPNQGANQGSGIKANSSLQQIAQARQQAALQQVQQAQQAVAPSGITPVNSTQFQGVSSATTINAPTATSSISEPFQVSHGTQYPSNADLENLPPDVAAFYRGKEEEVVHRASEMNDKTPSSDVFKAFPEMLQKMGGSSDPTSLLKAQYDIGIATLQWSFYGQLASKAVSGVQTLFNNQV